MAVVPSDSLCKKVWQLREYDISNGISSRTVLPTCNIYLFDVGVDIKFPWSKGTSLGVGLCGSCFWGYAIKLEEHG